MSECPQEKGLIGFGHLERMSKNFWFDKFQKFAIDSLAGGQHAKTW